MKHFKWSVLIIILFSVSKSHSQQPGGYGWNCYHNGVFYTMVGRNMVCPNPGLFSSNVGTLAEMANILTLVKMENVRTLVKPENVRALVKPENVRALVKPESDVELLIHDPNDHNCVITRSANTNY